MSGATLKVALDSRLRERLDRLSRLGRQSASSLALEAIRYYVEISEAQIREIRKALQEADQGDFASEREIQKVLKKWTKNA